MKFYGDDEKMYHIRLNAKRRAIVAHLKETWGAKSKHSAICACIDLMGRKLGLPTPTYEDD